MRKEFVESFGTEAMPAGEYEVVFAPPVTGLLAHESFGHGVEMDQFVKDRAKAREFLNKPVASSIVTLVDDPSIAGGRGSYPFDDEGVIAGPTRIIENGVFVRPLTDLMSATFLGTARTPNGRTQGWDRKPYARMSNTFIAPGSTDPGGTAGQPEGRSLPRRFPQWHRGSAGLGHPVHRRDGARVPGRQTDRAHLRTRDGDRVRARDPLQHHHGRERFRARAGLVRQGLQGVRGGDQRRSAHPHASARVS